MASDALDKVFGLIDGYSDAMIDFQTGMTAIPALGPDNDGEGESKKAEYIEKYVSFPKNGLITAGNHWGLRYR